MNETKPKKIEFHWCGKVIHKLQRRQYFDEEVVFDIDRMIELGIIKPAGDKTDDD